MLRHEAVAGPDRYADCEQRSGFGQRGEKIDDNEPRKRKPDHARHNQDQRADAVREFADHEGLIGFAQDVLLQVARPFRRARVGPTRKHAQSYGTPERIEECVTDQIAENDDREDRHGFEVASDN